MVDYRNQSYGKLAAKLKKAQAKKESTKKSSGSGGSSSSRKSSGGGGSNFSTFDGSSKSVNPDGSEKLFSSEKDAPVASKVGGGTISQGEAEQQSTRVVRSSGGGSRRRTSTPASFEPNFSDQDQGAVNVPPPETNVVRAKRPKSSPAGANFTDAATGMPSVAPPPTTPKPRKKQADPENFAFFSLEGQKNRFKRTGRTYAAILNPFDDTKVEFTLFQDSQSRAGRAANVVGQFLTPQNPLDVGLLALAGGGAAAAVAGKAGKGAQAAKAASKAAAAGRASSVAKLQAFLSRTGITGVAKVGAQGALVSYEADRFADASRPDIGLEDAAFNAVYGQSLESSKKEGIVGALGYDLTLFAGSKAEFKKTARAEFAARGLKGKQLDAAVNEAVRTRTIMGVGEAAAFLNIARASESVGRANVNAAFNKAAKAGKVFPKDKAGLELFKMTFTPIAKAGAAEGVATVFTQDIARKQKTDPAELLIGGALGAATAGVIGGSIAGTRVNKPGVSKFIEYGAYITDPFEKPGDLLQDVTEFAVKKTTGKAATKPTVFTAVNPMDIMSVGTTTPANNKNKGKGAKRPNLPGIIGFSSENNINEAMAQMQNSVNQQQQGNKKKGRGGKAFGAPTNVPVGIKTPTNVPVPAIFDTPRINPSNVPSNPIIPDGGTVPVPPSIPEFVPPDVPADVPADVPVNINVPAAVPISIPAVTPQFRIPPPIPLQFPAGSGSGASYKGERKRYVNELDAALGILGFNAGGNAAQKASKKASKQSGRKMKSSSKRKPSQPEILGLLWDGRLI